MLVKTLQNTSCAIWCDNYAVVYCFSNHKIKDDLLSACVMTAWYICAVYNINFTVKHIRGDRNIYADILSRWHFYRNNADINVEKLLRCQWVVSKHKFYVACPF